MSDEVASIPQQAAPSAGEQGARSFVQHAKLIGLLTLASRALGVVRQMVVAHYFGMGLVASAFTVAFSIPNLFRRLFGEGALSAAFIPLYAQALKNEDAKAANQFAAASVNLLCILLLGITLVGEIVLVSLAVLRPMRLERLLAVQFTAIMLPYALLICSTAFLSAILQVHRRFGPPAAAPILLNVCHITVMLLGAKLLHLQVSGGGEPPIATQVRLAYWLAGFVVVAGVLQVAMLLPALRQVGFRFAWVSNFWIPPVRKMLKLSVPVALGAGVLQVSVLLDKGIALLLSRGQTYTVFSVFGHEIRYPMALGAPARLDTAQLIYQFPLGVFAIALATAIFPKLSADAMDKDRTRFRTVLRQGIEVTLFEGFAASVGLIIVRYPLTRLLFHHGNVTGADIDWLASSVMYYSLGIWAFSLQQILNRAYYAMHDMTTPLVMSAVTLGVNLAVELPLLWTGLGEAGMAVGTTVSFSVQVLVMLAVLQRKAGGLGLSKSTGYILKLLAATAVMWGACVLVQRLPMYPAGTGRTTSMAQLVILILTGAAAYLGTCAVMGIGVIKHLMPKRSAAKATA